MAISYRARRRLAFLILLVGLPLYIFAAVTVVGFFDRPPIWLEFVIYALLGVLWVFPFKAIFRGVAQPDPDAPPSAEASIETDGAKDGTTPKS